MKEPQKPEERKRPLSWNLLAEERIQAAQADGEFDNLPGFGKPIPGIDEPHDELWWVKQKLKREQLSRLPPALAIRLDVQTTLRRVSAPVDVQPLEADAIIRCWRAGKSAAD